MFSDRDECATTFGFSGRLTARLAGISYRQLDYWCRVGIIEPDSGHAEGSGSRRRFSLHQVRCLAFLAACRTMTANLDFLGALAEHLEPDVLDADIVLVSIDDATAVDATSVDLRDVVESGAFLMSRSHWAEGLDEALAGLPGAVPHREHVLVGQQRPSGHVRRQSRRPASDRWEW